MPLCSLLSESTASVCGLTALLSVRFSLHLGEMGSALGEAPFPQLQWHSTCAFRWCCLQMKPLFPKGEWSGQILQYLLFLYSSQNHDGSFICILPNPLCEGLVARTKARKKV